MLKMNTKISCLCFALLLMLGAQVNAQDCQANLKKHVYFMASDSLNGRKAGSPEARQVATYIAQQYAEAGLKPFFEDWYQDFGISGSLNANCRNVVGWIEGNDEQLKNQYIVVGAHYDHLGVKKGQIYNGADDNASGSAAVIEMARWLYLHRSELKYSVIFCAFDAEEVGLLGSGALAQILDQKGLIGKVKLMLSIDMVGWYGQSGFLRLAGVNTLDNGRELVQKFASDENGRWINIRAVGLEGSPITATDTEPFARRQVPTLAVTTGLKSPYHKPQDDADLIDYAGMERVTDYLVQLVEALASGKEPLASSGKVAYKHRDTLPALQLGVDVGTLDGTLRYDDANLASFSRKGWSCGLNLRWNMAPHWALQGGVYYNDGRLNVVEPDNLLGDSRKAYERDLMVPVMLQLQTGMPMTNFWLGMGGYYDRILSSRVWAQDVLSQLEPNQYGVVFGWGISISRLSFQLMYTCPLGNYYGSDCGFESSKSQFRFSIGFLF